MNEKLYDILMKLPRKNIINIMWSALDEMQAYNGRSRTECIRLAVGGEEHVNEEGRLVFKVGTLADLKRNTETMGL